MFFELKFFSFIALEFHDINFNKYFTHPFVLFIILSP